MARSNLKQLQTVLNTSVSYIWVIRSSECLAIAKITASSIVLQSVFGYNGQSEDITITRIHLTYQYCLSHKSVDIVTSFHLKK